jgi:hypothetical protein
MSTSPSVNSSSQTRRSWLSQHHSLEMSHCVRCSTYGESRGGESPVSRRERRVMRSATVNEIPSVSLFPSKGLRTWGCQSRGGNKDGSKSPEGQVGNFESKMNFGPRSWVVNSSKVDSISQRSLVERTCALAEHSLGSRMVVTWFTSWAYCERAARLGGHCSQ